MITQHRQQIIDSEGKEFPSNSYRSMVLEPAYDQAKTNFIEPMIDIQVAHLIMLVEEGIIEKKEAIHLINAIKKIDVDSVKQSTYHTSYEDLFFRIEDFLIKEAGDMAGNLHIARSRNDMGIAIYRMTLRKRILELISSGLRLRKILIELSEEYIDTVMIGYTHTQQAQPTTLGHYFNALTDVLTRDIYRLIKAFDTVNSSSMGACALTTTGFPINRHRVKELLGFERLIENSYDAVAGADYIGETACAVELAAINLGRSIQDFLLWATQEFGAILLSNPYVQISSIMPQKRNPVAIEHMRALLSSVVGNAQTVLTMTHNTPFGDIVDTEDDMQPYLWKAIETLKGVYHLLGNVLMTMEVNREKLLKRAKESFANVTELADTLVRKENLSFRQAHKVVSGAVKELVSQGGTLEGLNLDLLNRHAEPILKRKLRLSEQELNQALDPVYFVNVRSLEGGPSPLVMKMALQERRREQDQLAQWVASKDELIATAREKRNKIVQDWMGSKGEDADD